MLAAPRQIQLCVPKGMKLPVDSLAPSFSVVRSPVRRKRALSATRADSEASSRSGLNQNPRAGDPGEGRWSRQEIAISWQPKISLLGERSGAEGLYVTMCRGISCGSRHRRWPRVLVTGGTGKDIRRLFFPGRNRSAGLLHKGRKIRHPPVVGDPAVLDAHDVDGLQPDLAVSGSDPKKWPCMRAPVGFIRRHSIAVGKLPVDLGMKVRERGANASVEFSYTRLVCRGARLRCVIDEIVREEFVKNIEVSRVLDLFDIPADNVFGRLGRSDAAHLADSLAIHGWVD